MTENDGRAEYELEIPEYVEGEDPEFDKLVEAGARAFEEFIGTEVTDFDKVMAGIAANQRREAARARFTRQGRDPKEQKRHEKAVQKRKKAKRGGPR